MFHDNSARSAPDLFAYKTANQTILNDTLTDITDLSVDVVSGRTYQLKGVLWFHGLGSVSGINVAFSGTSTMSSFKVGCPNTVGVAYAAQWTALNQTIKVIDGNSPDEWSLLIEGTFVVSGNGTFKVQATSLPGDLGFVSVKQGCHILLWRQG